MARPKRTALAERDPFRVGMVAIAGAAVVALIVLLLSVVPFGKTTYTAILAQSAGLVPKEDVQIHGVRVGEVRSVDLRGDVVAVRFTVSRDIHLGSQTTGAVKVATLLGTHFLAIDPRGGGSLAGGTIPLARTSVPFNLQDVLDQGTQKVSQLDAPELAKLLTTMTSTLTPSTPDLGPALAGVVRLSDVVAERSGQLGDLLTAARAVTQQLSSSSTDIVSLMKATNLVVQEVTDRRRAIHLLLTEATRLAGNVNAILDQTRANVHPALVALNGALAELRAQDKTLKGVLDVMAPAVRYVANATGNGPWGDLYEHTPALPPDDFACKTGSIKGCVK